METPEIVSVDLNEHIVISNNAMVAAIIFGVGVFGLTSNLLVLWMVYWYPHLKNPFGIICLSHSVANAGVITVFCVWAAPMCLLQDLEVAGGYWGKKLGHLNLMLWNVCVYSHIVVSFNRVVSIAFPALGSRILTVKTTLLMVGWAWSMGLIHGIPYWWSEECFVSFNPTSWTWDFAPTECGYIISTYTDCYTTLIALCTITTLDCYTFYKIRMSSQRIGMNAGPSESIAVAKRRAMEVRFFAQSAAQGAVFFYELAMFYFVCYFMENQWALYFTTTFAWQICHSLDGAVIVAFHYRRSSGTNSSSTPTQKISKIGSNSVVQETRSRGTRCSVTTVTAVSRERN